MEINYIPTSTSFKFPELKNNQKFLITQPDDKGFAQEQVDKLIQGMYMRRQLKLKPWEKYSYQNIYKSSGKSNHEILQNLKMKINSCKTISNEDLTNTNYYKDYQLKTINSSQDISKQILANINMRRKFKQPSTNIKRYTIETKQICKNNMLSELIKSERDKMKIKLNKYERALKNEIKNLNNDIFKFEHYTTNEMFKTNQQSKYINNIESLKKIYIEELKSLNQEYHSLKSEIPRTIKRINDKKIYVNFVHKLFGGEPELSNCNLDDINYQNLTEKDLHSITNMIETEMNKSKTEDNILITSTEEEILGNINKIDIVFKFMEENIMKTMEKNENIRNEILLLNEYEENELKDLEQKIKEREKEYNKILEEYQHEKQNADFIYCSNEEYINFIRKLHIELFECVNEAIIKNKSDIDEYNIIDKIIKPTLKDIKEKESKIDNLIINMEKYSIQDKILFNNSVTKIKNENKILKYHQEKRNREIQNTLKNEKILEKINKLMVTGRYKYKSPVPLNIIKKRRNNLRELKTEPSDFKLLYY